VKMLLASNLSATPVVQEQQLLSKLKEAHVCAEDRLRLRIVGRRLLVDGFVASLDQKIAVEAACRQFAPSIRVVNRLRVAWVGVDSVA